MNDTTWSLLSEQFTMVFKFEVQIKKKRNSFVKKAYEVLYGGYKVTWKIMLLLEMDHMSLLVHEVSWFSSLLKYVQYVYVYLITFYIIDIDLRPVCYNTQNFWLNDTLWSFLNTKVTKICLFKFEVEIPKQKNSSVKKAFKVLLSCPIKDSKMNLN